MREFLTRLFFSSTREDHKGTIRFCYNRKDVVRNDDEKAPAGDG